MCCPVHLLCEDLGTHHPCIPACSWGDVFFWTQDYLSRCSTHGNIGFLSGVVCLCLRCFSRPVTVSAWLFVSCPTPLERGVLIPTPTLPFLQFFGIYQIASLVGSVGTGILLDSGANYQFVFIILTGVSLCGVSLFFFCGSVSVCCSTVHHMSMFPCP